jgi:hypothetical protein
MKLPELGTLVKGDKVSKFKFFRDATLWYEVEGFQYPIAGDDLKGATFHAEEKALLHMRWIRKYLAYLQECIDKANEHGR